MAKIVIARSDDQFVLLPSVGIIKDEDGWYVAFALGSWCVNIRLLKKVSKKVKKK